MTTPTIELKPSSNPLSDAEREAILADPGFGRHFTDHMVTIRGPRAAAGTTRSSCPYAPLSIDPATMVLHYAQEIFEGLKAYRQPDGSVATFRPERERRALPALRPAAGDARAARRDVHRGRRRAGPAGPGVGARARRRGVALPAPVHDRHRGRPRRQAGQRVPLPASSPPRPARTSPAASSPSRSGCPRTTSAPFPAARATPRPAATTRPPCSPRPRPPSRAATRSSGSTPSSTSGSRRWAG